MSIGRWRRRKEEGPSGQIDDWEGGGRQDSCENTFILFVKRGPILFFFFLVFRVLINSFLCVSFEAWTVVGKKDSRHLKEATRTRPINPQHKTTFMTCSGRRFSKGLSKFLAYSICPFKSSSEVPRFIKRFTHVEPPGDLVRPRVGPDVALEVDVLALPDVGAVQGRSQAQDGLGNVWRTEEPSIKARSFGGGGGR